MLKDRKKIVLGIVLCIVLCIMITIVIGGIKKKENKKEIEDNISEQKKEIEQKKENKKVSDKDQTSSESKERILSVEQPKYKFVNESDYDVNIYGKLNYSKSENMVDIDYYFDSCLNKEMPKVTFKLENGKLVIEKFYETKYYINLIANVKEFVIRDFQSNSSKYLVILTEDGEVYASHLWGTCSTGAETVLTPEELENNLIKIKTDSNISTLEKVTANNLSLVSLYNGNNKLLLSFE